ncbi:MAG: ABC transporter permease subunit [Planctomycetes bacterium]|nr:ABC transporter permease subunit [Planctomycetota bacterium]
MTAWRVLGVATAAVLLLTVAEPLRALVAEAMAADGGAFAFLTETGPRGPQALVGTLVLSVVSVLLALAIGGGLALVLHLADFPGRRALEVLAPLPIALPPLVGSFAFLILLEKDGILPRAIRAATGADVDLGGWTGVLVVHAFTMAPFPYLFVRAALGSMDGSRVEAARSLGSGPVRSFVDAALPQLGPAILASSLLVFLTAAGSFTAPWYFTPGQPVMTLAIFRAHGRDPGLAASTTVVLALATLAVLAIFLRVQRAQTTGASKGVPPVPRRLRGGARVAAGAAAAVAIAVLLLPHAALVLLSFHDPRAWRTEILPPSYSFAAYAEAFGSSESLRPVWTSVWTSLVATGAAVAVGLAVAALVVWRRVRGRIAFAVLAMAPFAVPGTALAVNLLFAFGRGRWFLAGAALSGTVLLLPLAYFIRTLPVTYQGAAAALQRLPGDLVPAARSLGATPAIAFRTVVLPALWPTLAAAALLSFVTSVGEFVASILLYAPGGEPISVHIDQLYRNTNTIAVPAAYASVLTLVAAAASSAVRR